MELSYGDLLRQNGFKQEENKRSLSIEAVILHALTDVVRSGMRREMRYTRTPLRPSLCMNYIPTKTSVRLPVDI